MPTILIKLVTAEDATPMSMIEWHPLFLTCLLNRATIANNEPYIPGMPKNLQNTASITLLNIKKGCRGFYPSLVEFSMEQSPQIFVCSVNSPSPTSFLLDKGHRGW